LKERVCISGQTVKSTKESGKTIKWMVSECLLGLMEKGTRENLLMIKDMARVFSSGQMAENTMEIGKLESSMVLVSTIIMKEKLKKENGKKAKERIGLIDLKIITYSS